jgi:hypothetical protein
VPSNGIFRVKKTAASRFTGSTQNSVDAAPCQKNSTSAPRLSRTGEEIALGDPGVQVVGRHQLHGRSFEDADPVKFAFVQQHPGKSHVVVERRSETG